MENRFVLLCESETAGLLTMGEVARICEAVLAEWGRRAARLSQPEAMFLEADSRAPTLFKVKGGVIPSLDACGFRIVGDVGPDGQLGESHYCCLFDPKSGEPRALVSHTAIHRMRTAASGLVAVKALAPPGLQTVALIGAGRIGRHLALGFPELFPGKRLLIASRKRDAAVRLATEAASPSASIAAAENVAAALAEAEAAITLTSSASPVMAAADFHPGMTLIGMGEHHELPVGVLEAADRFLVDDFGFASVLGSLAAWIRSGAISREEASGRADATLGAVMAGLAPGRRTPRERILCIVQGLAIADLALSELCRRKALGLPMPGMESG